MKTADHLLGKMSRKAKGNVLEFDDIQLNNYHGALVPGTNLGILLMPSNHQRGTLNTSFGYQLLIQVCADFTSHLSGERDLL